MTEDETIFDSPAASELLANIMAHNAAETASLTNLVEYHLIKRAVHAEAMVFAIQESIAALLDGPYTPSESAIVKALFPSVGTVKCLMREIAREADRQVLDLDDAISSEDFFNEDFIYIERNGTN